MPQPYTWDSKTQRYRSPSGAFVSRADVRQALDAVIAKSERRSQALAVELQQNRIALEDWAAAMRAEIKRQHLMAAAAARGGWANLTASDFGVVGQRVRRQYQYLEGFARSIADGLPLNGAFVRRVAMYDNAARSAFHDLETRGMREAGYDEERNVLHPADHCYGCLRETAREWVPLGELVPIGSRPCLTMCRCTKAYRRGGT